MQFKKPTGYWYVFETPVPSNNILPLCKKCKKNCKQRVVPRLKFTCYDFEEER